MKTFLEFIQQQVGCAYDLRIILDNLEEGDITESVNDYAKEVAKQALINASENSKLKLRDDWLDLHEFDCCECIDKQSILNESNIPVL